MVPHFMRTHMHINLHPVERVVRILLGVFMLIMAFSADRGIGAIWGLGIYPFLTGIIGWDPVYYFLNFNTNRWARVKVDHTKR